MSIQETTKGLARATLYVACLSIGSLNLLAETKTVKMVQTTETQAAESEISPKVPSLSFSKNSAQFCCLDLALPL